MVKTQAETLEHYGAPQNQVTNSGNHHIDLSGL